MTDTRPLPFTHHVAQVKLDPDELRRRLQIVTPVQLLLSLIHVTADPSLLDRYGERVGFQPVGRLVLVSPPAKPAEPGVREALVEELVAALSRDGQPRYLGIEDRALVKRMAELAVGMPIADLYLDMHLEQGGFQPDRQVVPVTRSPPKDFKIAAIGAGMTGLDVGVKAARRGFTYDIYEKEAGIGGLWWSQIYPGVAVDTPSMYYSMSYEVTPDWQKYFPMGAEYRAYLHNLADKYHIAQHVHLNTEIPRMRWDEGKQMWELTTVSKVDGGQSSAWANAVITGAGHLNRPKFPDVPGRESFKGLAVHTCHWRPDIDVKGKRVAVVGAGAAAVQVVGAIAEDVEHLTVFQRQPHWIFPNNLGVGDVGDDERWLRRHLPYYLHWSRFRVFWSIGDDMGYGGYRVDREWAKDHLTISPENDYMMQFCLDYIAKCFGEGSEMAKKLTPDFPVGGKRMVRDPGAFAPGGYYYALAQPHVDLETSALAQVVPEGIVTADGKLIELDVIVWATGMTLDWLSTIEVIGRDGRKLSDVWAGNNPRTYLGGTVPGFPNLFVNDGPNTGLGHGGGHNFMTEIVNHYAFECLQLVVENDAQSIEVTQEAHDVHNARLEERMKGSIWAHEFKAHTYYRNDAGRVLLPSPWRFVEYWNMSQQPEPSRFLIDGRPAEAARPAAPAAKTTNAAERAAAPAPAAE